MAQGPGPAASRTETTRGGPGRFPRPVRIETRVPCVNDVCRFSRESGERKDGVATPASYSDLRASTTSTLDAR